MDIFKLQKGNYKEELISKLFDPHNLVTGKLIIFKKFILFLFTVPFVHIYMKISTSTVPKSAMFILAQSMEPTITQIMFNSAFWPRMPDARPKAFRTRFFPKLYYFENIPFLAGFWPIPISSPKSTLPCPTGHMVCPSNSIDFIN